MSLTVRVIAPDKTVWDAIADEVILPSTTGQVGILSGHAPLITALDTAVMQVKSGKEKWIKIALMGGFAEVDANEVTVLVLNWVATLMWQQRRRPWPKLSNKSAKLAISKSKSRLLRLSKKPALGCKQLVKNRSSKGIGSELAGSLSILHIR